MNPRLRFKREDGTDYPDWEEKKLGEVLTQRRDIQTISEKAPLLAFTIEDGVIDPKDKKTNKRDFLIKDKENKKFQLTKYDDIIYNPANIKFGAIHRNKFGEGVVSPIYVILKTNQNPSFVEYSLKRESFISKTKKYLEGTVEKLRTLKSENFLSLSVFLPCLEEQEKIGSFLSDIDEVILASDQEVKKLQELKKGAMQKIFSQEVRFKRDDGTYYPDWEEKKLIDIFNIRNGYTPSKQEESYWKGNTIIPWLRLEDIRENGRILKDSIQHVTPSAVKGELFKKNSIIISTTATIGEHALIEVDFLANQQFTILTLKNEFKEKFLHKFIFYHTYKLSNYSKNNIKSGGFHAVEMSKFKEFIFSIPCLEEQQKIGDFLSDFDEAISLAKQELEKWKLLKKGFLQQMFT